jgi:integrase
MLVEDYLPPAAVKVGILSSHRDDEGRLVDDDPRRFGFHNLHHSLASFLVRIRTDPKTVQTLLRHMLRFANIDDYLYGKCRIDVTDEQ